MALILFILAALVLGLIITDYVATVQALGHGYVEANPVMRRLFAKFGQPVTTFLSAAVFLVGFALWTAYDATAGAVYAGIIAAFQLTVMLPRAIKMLKKYGLK